MENKGHLQAQEIQIQGLLDNFLKLQTISNQSAVLQENHLDDDSLAAFVEGNLSRREATPVVSHLADCSFCRHVTAELVKLDYAFAETEEVRTIPAEAAEPASISAVLSGLLSRIFGSSDGAVFAHQENDEKEDDPEKSESEKQSKNE